MFHSVRVIDNKRKVFPCPGCGFRYNVARPGGVIIFGCLCLFLVMHWSSFVSLSCSQIQYKYLIYSNQRWTLKWRFNCCE